MTRRRWARLLALVWATLQLASPGVSAAADAFVASEAASAPQSHVEAPDNTSCPEVHSPDCGVCRYLSTGMEPVPGGALIPAAHRVVAPAASRVALESAPGVSLPHGRAPPVA